VAVFQGMSDLFSLEARTALVTGARGGIGRAIAIALARAGADLILHGHRDNLAETAGAVSAVGREPETFLLDLADPAAVRPAAEELLARRRIDVLVNNAGIIPRAPALETTPEDWRATLSVNLDSAFALTQAVAAPMVARRAGKVINVASVLSFQGGIRVPAYTASKHALAGLTRALANEWAPHDVQVNAIAPGYIVTDNTRAIREDPERHAEIERRIPAGRWGRPDDVAGAAVFLASTASDYVNGHVLVVDGGWLAR
jgi:2-deoxy-D-gluconate 3-dehydrogenase